MIYIMTHAGTGKAASEDAVLVGTHIYSGETGTADIPEDGFVCVADGVGGNNAGEVASHFVLSEIAACTKPEKEDFRIKLLQINRRLLEKSKEEDSLSGMATTLSGIYFGRGKAAVIHVGNTRVYAMQGHYLKQLTSDHTVYNFLKGTGRYEEAEACNKNEITNCFGGNDEKLIERLQIFQTNMANSFLLTSDGIHEYVNLEKLEEIMNSGLSNEEKCTAIRNAALAGGSGDDMTAVLICSGNPSN